MFWIVGPQIVSNKECLQFIRHEELQIQYKDDEDIFVNLRLRDSFHDAFRCAQPVSGTTIHEAKNQNAEATKINSRNYIHQATWM